MNFLKLKYLKERDEYYFVSVVDLLSACDIWLLSEFTHISEKSEFFTN